MVSHAEKLALKTYPLVFCFSLSCQLRNMINILTMATAIHTIQKRKLPLSAGTSVSTKKGTKKSRMKRKTNQMTQNTKDFCMA